MSVWSVVSLSLVLVSSRGCVSFPRVVGLLSLFEVEQMKVSKTLVKCYSSDK